ncbi:MAG: branched-chain amino acid ABC transporter permease LivH [SAR324 cluster bacterium]|nr:branched-chain amino acid ABC transporter permease LivH [SAR324 cluster bacterium]MCZ6558992.1 branched-chain amino acid ABC transporter permease LivH [SAR324 cluster bacterium]MCZ6627112.1 branched-chain amino acid ABC transporter permease LivH [SAR324 cluster bacterium]MCZ6644769.1 branched-chain amino acid ABC transporter permease LivH [SAR324 cluster bacterium]MCZ6729728.1 branched-chain amino acid ABC transporter permease LivH [SAR324 cluster bacterium]
MYILGQQLINGLILGSIYGLIAIGYTMVYGIIGMINFAHGEIYMISAYLFAIFLALAGVFGIDSLPVALLFTLAFTIIITGLYGFTVERMAYRPLRGSTRLAPLISAIGMSLVLQNFVQLAQGANDQALPPLYHGVLRLGGEEDFVQITHIQIIIVAATVISMAILTYVINNTALGRACRATQQDRTMANLLGINTDWTISLVFVIGASMASVAGVLITFNFGSFNFFIGFVAGIKAFTAAVLGGIGSLPGAMLGGILLGLSESLFAGFVNTDYKDVFAFALLVTVLTFRPTGLLGRPEVEKI